MDRIKFCPECDEVLAWDAKKCRECGAPVPEDPKAFEKARARKEAELEKIRRTARPKPKPRPTRSGPPPVGTEGRRTPTANAITLAVVCFACGVLALFLGLFSDPPRPVFALVGYVLLGVCNLAVFWVIIHSAVVSAIRVTRDE